MKIWGSPENIYVRKIEVACRYAGVEFAIHPYDPEIAKKEDHDHYLKTINPNGTVPSLVTKDGPIWESRAILRYIARLDKKKGLYGSNLFQESQVDQWLDWSARELTQPLLTYIGPFLGWTTYDKATHDQVTEDIKKIIKVLNDSLKKTKFLLGEQITIADIELASTLSIAFQLLWDEKFRKPLPNLAKWFENVINEENWKKANGRSIICKTALAPFVPEQKKAKKETGKKKKEEQPKKEEGKA